MNRFYMPGINLLAEELKKVSQSKGFAPTTDDNLPEKLMLVVSEIAEAMEEHRAKRGMLYHVGEKPEGVAAELADAVIRILHICNDLGINIAEVLALKAGYNETRPAMHGGKRY